MDSPEERSRRVLELCQYELRGVPAEHLLTLALAITSEIRIACRESVEPYLSPKKTPQPDPKFNFKRPLR